MNIWHTAFDASPFVTTLCMILLIGWCAFLSGIVTILAGAAIDHLRKSYAASRRRFYQDLFTPNITMPYEGNPSAQIQPQEVHMKGRLVLVAIMAIALTAISMLQTGCTLFGGSTDNLPYDISFTVTLDDGTQLVAVTDEYGLHIYGQYTDPATGIVFIADPDGNISATDEDGNQIMLTRRTEIPNTTDPEPAP